MFPNQTDMKLLSVFFLLFSSIAGIAQELNKAYSKFDFVPGDKVVYYNNFEEDALGELPTGWNTTGSGEVVKMNNSKWVKLLQNALFITDNTQAFSKDFTVEFDLFLDFKSQDALFPMISFGIVGTGTTKPTDNAVLQNIFGADLLAVDLNAGIEQNSFTKLISYSNGSEFFNTGEKPFRQLEQLLQQTIHVSMQVQQQRFRLWLNENKLFDIPQALPSGADINQLFFRVFESSYTNDQIGTYVSNIKVAKGLPDTRNKLLTEGRFSTSGILFDVNFATIKAESYGVIKEIADIMKSNPGLKVLVVGHTDADGTEVDNLRLSKQRSEAVKRTLIESFGVAAASISTDGRGESQPVADNRTKEGKAQNRRVEFIKQ